MWPLFLYRHKGAIVTRGLPMTQSKTKTGAPALFRRLPLKHKMALLALGIVLLMLLTGGVNILLVTRATHTVQTILHDNQVSYDLQQAMAEERRCFQELTQTPGAESRAAFEAAAERTAQCLAAVPYDYALTGEARFESTWTVRSSYETYCFRRDTVLAMDPESAGYISALYDVYAMQEYLERYCSQLTARVLESGAAVYEAESVWMLRLPYLLAAVLLAATLGLLFMLYRAVRDLLHNLLALAQASRHIEQNDFSDPDLVWESNDEMGQLTSAFNKMKHATRENIAIKERLHREELERAELGKRFAAAQFQALKNQLNPHFLFNTLNTIARMARIEGAPTSEQMTLAVSNLLRYTLRTNDPLVPLAQEIKVVEDYMYIQQMRFGERVRYRLDCQADTAALVPVFLLQPLVENAVHHGLSGKEEGGAVCICVRQAPSGRLRISVNDTGGGMPPERLEAVRRAMVEGDNAQGIGLGNLGRRIAGTYADGWVQVYSRPGCGTSVIMEFGAPRELG